jgi:hypothetical protein
VRKACLPLPADRASLQPPEALTQVLELSSSFLLVYHGIDTAGRSCLCLPHAFSLKACPDSGHFPILCQLLAPLAALATAWERCRELFSAGQPALTSDSDSHLCMSLREGHHRSPEAIRRFVPVIHIQSAIASSNPSNCNSGKDALSVGYLLVLPAYILAALLYNFFLRSKKYKTWSEEFICQRCGFRPRIWTQRRDR